MPAMAFPRVRVQVEDFDLRHEIDALHAGDRRVGAICSFVGTVRDRNDGSDVASLELEHYPGMTEQSMRVSTSSARAWCTASGCCSRPTGS